jgi:dihydroflavonol-4-reductase
LDVERVPGDVLDLDSLKRAFSGADVVLHLAARISIVTRDHDMVRAVNVGGVRNVIEACKAARVGRLIHTSSFHAHRQDPLDEPMDESRPLLGPGTYPPYDHSKAEGERVVRTAASEGLDAIVINPTGMIGPNDFKPSHFGETIVSMVNGQLPAIVRAGLNWVDTRDVADGVIRAYETAAAGSKFILSGHWASLEEIARHVATVTGGRPPRFTLPMWLAELVAPVAAAADTVRGRRPQFTPISMNELKSNPDIRHDLARRELGYQPRPLADTLTDTVEWFRAKGFLND